MSSVVPSQARFTSLSDFFERPEELATVDELAALARISHQRSMKRQSPVA
jgi:hypothetical protein